MWFRTVYLKTLRDFRIAILGWGFGIGLLMLAVLTAVPSLVNTAAAKASLVSLAQSFAWLAEPVSITTPGGYATWKYGPTILVLAIWPLLVGSRMLRGEEERGSLDTLLSLPRSRVQIALQKYAAMWTALAAMGLIIAVLVWLGGFPAKGNYGFGGSLLFSLNLILACGIFGSLALFLAQFTTERRTAAGIAGALLLISIWWTCSIV
jgi:ABC-2 type transport system permease protein